VRVPLFLQLVRTNEDRGESVLESYPSIVLSDTWWGSFTDGEIAYWLPTRARRAITPDVSEPHFAVCPFLLANRSDVPLPIERFAVNVSYPTVCASRSDLWTDEVQVRYEGVQEGSELRYTGRVPKEAGPVEQMVPPAEPPPGSLHARTFGRLRALSGLS
jgi:hypothetical protein